VGLVDGILRAYAYHLNVVPLDSLMPTPPLAVPWK
jgi:hypothetical protein